MPNFRINTLPPKRSLFYLSLELLSYAAFIVAFFLSVRKSSSHFILIFHADTLWHWRQTKLKSVSNQSIISNAGQVLRRLLV